MRGGRNEAPPPVGHGEHQPAGGLERPFALLEEAEHVGRVLDHVRRHDVVIPRRADEAGQRLPCPHVVNLLDLGGVDVLLAGVLLPQRGGGEVIHDLHPVAIPLRHDGVVTGPDLQAEPRGIEEAADRGLSGQVGGEML